MAYLNLLKNLLLNYIFNKLLYNINVLNLFIKYYYIYIYILKQYYKIVEPKDNF